MQRTYTHCPHCSTRMIRVHEEGPEYDLDWYYLCRACKTTVTLMTATNCAPEGWPERVYDIAVRKGLMTRKQVPKK